MTYGHAPQVKGLPFGGPWRILADCPATSHNTCGSARVRRDKPKCVYPRALELLERRNASEKYRHRERRKARVPVRLMIHPPEGVMPDFSRGACSRPEYAAIAHAGQTEAITWPAIRAREAAKNICNTVCPIRDACRAYVLTEEKPAGVWGSVWGGLDAWNRTGRTITIVDGKAVTNPYAIH